MLNCTRSPPGCFTLIGDKAPPTARDYIDIARTLNRRCHPHAGNFGLRMMLKQQPILVGIIALHDECMDIVRSAPQGLTIIKELGREHVAYDTPSWTYTNSVPD